MARKILIAGIDDDVYKRFRAYCFLKEISMSEELRNHIEKCSRETKVTKTGITTAETIITEEAIISMSEDESEEDEDSV